MELYCNSISKLFETIVALSVYGFETLKGVLPDLNFDDIELMYRRFIWVLMYCWIYLSWKVVHLVMRNGTCIVVFDSCSSLVIFISTFSLKSDMMDSINGEGIKRSLPHLKEIIEILNTDVYLLYSVVTYITYPGLKYTLFTPSPLPEARRNDLNTELDAQQWHYQFCTHEDHFKDLFALLSPIRFRQWEYCFGQSDFDPIFTNGNSKLVQRIDDYDLHFYTFPNYSIPQINQSRLEMVSKVIQWYHEERMPWMPDLYDVAKLNSSGRSMVLNFIEEILVNPSTIHFEGLWFQHVFHNFDFSYIEPQFWLNDVRYVFKIIRDLFDNEERSEWMKKVVRS